MNQYDENIKKIILPGVYGFNFEKELVKIGYLIQINQNRETEAYGNSTN